MWKCAYHSTRLDGTKLFIPLCALVCTLDQKAISTNEINAQYEKICVPTNKGSSVFVQGDS